MNYFKLALFLQKGNKDLFDTTYDEQKNYLDRIGDAKNDVDRSFKQYLCQNFFVPQYKTLILHLFAGLIFPFVLFYLIIKRFFLKRKEKIDAYGEFVGLEETIPEVLTSTYDIHNSRCGQEMSLDCRTDIKVFLKLLVLHPFLPLFVLKCMMRIAQYSHIIYSFQPSSIIVHDEYSYTSSILTWYCNLKGVKHINVMHGEKFFYIRDSFFHFNECYIWDDYYRDLFISLKAENTQFIKAIPPSLRIDVLGNIKKDVFAEYKYYLQDFTDNEISSIVKSMSFVVKSGAKVKYRPHPRYSNVQLLKKYVSNDEIEDPYKVNIIESVSNLDYAVGSFTTVLTQAYFSGKGVICDDVTFKNRYNKLKDLKYILANISLPRLSEFQ